MSSRHSVWLIKHMANFTFFFSFNMLQELTLCSRSRTCEGSFVPECYVSKNYVLIWTHKVLPCSYSSINVTHFKEIRKVPFRNTVSVIRMSDNPVRNMKKFCSQLSTHFKRHMRFRSKRTFRLCWEQLERLKPRKKISMTGLSHWGATWKKK
jgi:hypothetical protein